MAYARVNMAEFASREDMHKMMGSINKDIKKIFPTFKPMWLWRHLKRRRWHL